MFVHRPVVSGIVNVLGGQLKNIGRSPYFFGELAPPHRTVQPGFEFAKEV